jgi:hypothetical protein
MPGIGRALAAHLRHCFRIVQSHDTYPITPQLTSLTGTIPLDSMVVQLLFGALLIVARLTDLPSPEFNHYQYSVVGNAPTNTLNSPNQRSGLPRWLDLFAACCSTTTPAYPPTRLTHNRPSPILTLN